jgi:hypothetical protein
MCNGFGDPFSDEKGWQNTIGSSTQLLVEASFNLEIIESIFEDRSLAVITAFPQGIKKCIQLY